MREVLWQPDPDWALFTRMAEFTRWVEADQGLEFADYNALWRWSVAEIEAFWDALARFADVPFGTRAQGVLPERKMPGADWFPGSTLNYASPILRHVAARPDQAAIVSVSETFGREELSFAELGMRVASVAATLTAMGVGPGDRVVAV